MALDGVPAPADAVVHDQCAMSPREEDPDAAVIAGITRAELLARAAEANWDGVGDAVRATTLFEAALAATLEDDATSRADLISRIGQCQWEGHASTARNIAARRRRCACSRPSRR